MTCPLSGLAISGDTGFRGSDASCPPSVPRARSEPCNPRPRDHGGRFLSEPLQTNGRAKTVHVLPPSRSLPRHEDALLECPGPPQPHLITDPSTIGHLPMGSAPASFSDPWSSLACLQTRFGTDRTCPSPLYTSFPPLQDVGTEDSGPSTDQPHPMLGSLLQHGRQLSSFCPNTSSNGELPSDCEKVQLVCASVCKQFKLSIRIYGCPSVSMEDWFQKPP